MRKSLGAWPHWPWTLLGVYGAALVAALLLAPRLPPDPALQALADARSWLGIPRFGDVVSNVPIFAAGVAGLIVVLRRDMLSFKERLFFGILFGSVALTGVGSTYYHWEPVAARLVWDRLPLGLLTACLPAVVLADRATLHRAGLWALGIWLCIGPVSVLAWYEDIPTASLSLWPYFLVKAVGLGGAVLWLILLPARHSHSWGYIAALVLYALATAVELRDSAVLSATGAVSGHTLKHLLSALALAGLAWMVVQRRVRT